MAESTRFDSVAETYGARFVETNKTYYVRYAELLQRHCAAIDAVCEVGVGNGVIPVYWNQLRARENPKDRLVYLSVDPSPKMVELASRRSTGFQFIVQRGGLEDATELFSKELQKKPGMSVALLTSRMLHEAFIGYQRDAERLRGTLRRLHAELKPEYVIHGDADRVVGLDTDQTARLIVFQEQMIGHGHDPAIDFLSFDNNMVPFMASEGYKLIEEAKTSIPVPGFDESPWKFAIGVFRRLPDERNC